MVTLPLPPVINRYEPVFEPPFCIDNCLRPTCSRRFRTDIASKPRVALRQQACLAHELVCSGAAHTATGTRPSMLTEAVNTGNARAHALP